MMKLFLLWALLLPAGRTGSSTRDKNVLALGSFVACRSDRQQHKR